MKKAFVFVMIFCFNELYALSVDDFIIQQPDSGSSFYHPKVYLYQIWGDTLIKDDLIKTETYEQWNRYKDVVIYYYKNIEIVTARYIQNVPYRSIVNVVVTGKKYSTLSNFTIGDSISNVIAFYGIPTYEGYDSEEGLTYSVYKKNDPFFDFGTDEDPVREYLISFMHKDGMIQRIIVTYVHNM